MEVDAVHLVLDRPVADGGDVRHPAPAEVVEHRHLLGEAHRVVERQQRRRDHDRQLGWCVAAIALASTIGEGRYPSLDVWCSQMIVLTHPRALGPLGHVERSPVEVGRRRARAGERMSKRIVNIVTSRSSVRSYLSHLKGAVFNRGQLDYPPRRRRGDCRQGGDTRGRVDVDRSVGVTAVAERPVSTGEPGRSSRIGWIAFVVVLAAMSVVVLFSMETGLPEGSRLANPNPGAAPYPFSPMAKAVPASIVMSSMAVGLFGVLIWLSWKQRRMHWALIITVGTLFTGLVDPIANWATFASLNPETPHLPTTWAWVRHAPLTEPALSLLGGYSAYYVLTGLFLYWVVKKLVLSRATPTSWVGRHPLLAAVHRRVGGVPAAQRGAPVAVDAGGHARVHAVLRTGPPPRACAAAVPDPAVRPVRLRDDRVVVYRDDDNRSVVLSKLATLPPGRRGHRRDTSGRQVVVAGVLIVSSMLGPIGVFSIIRGAGLADKPTYAEYPFPVAKVYDPYGDLERAGKPGPFVR